MIVRQLNLLGYDEPAFDSEFRGVRRVQLAPDAWVDRVPGWLMGHAGIFEALCDTIRWRHEQREMYARTVDVPRLYGVLPADGPKPPVVEHMADALTKRYGEVFERISVAFYRDGRDSVAWHGDYVARKLPSALVASVSVGAPRRFLLRPKGGGRSIALSLGLGDLLVMGGSCQRTWQHCIPKVARAAPRISIMFRPKWEE